ncbi:Hypothetical predicted protein [Cloeon dipterum]|uniref:DUF4781 domain-containing protein n=1 Tax=Cloeon dipterum TaxID=197152 RepID=A0A8S1E1E0_9INSE|nr:Hypothetical predicted protein [Cloeon dipterum]
MAEMIDPENWQAEAKRRQCEFYTTLGYKVVWRGVPAEMKLSLTLMVAEHIFHCSPAAENASLSDLGLSRTERGTVNIIANKVVKYFPNQNVHISLVLIVSKWKKHTVEELVLRVEGGGETKFIDKNYRVYPDWNSFLGANRILPGQICFPANGRYTLAPTGMETLVEFGFSPSSSQKNRILAKILLLAFLGMVISSALVIAYVFNHDDVLAIVGAVIGIPSYSYLIITGIFSSLDSLKYS